MIIDPTQTIQKDRMGDWDLETDADQLPINPSGFARGSISFLRNMAPDAKEGIAELGEMVLGKELIHHPEPESYQTQEEQEEAAIKQETAVFIQQANQNLEQAQANVAPAELQERMKDIFRLGVDTSQEALDEEGIRENQLTRDKILAMATHQSEKKEEFEEQVKDAKSSNIIAGADMKRNFEDQNMNQAG